MWYQYLNLTLNRLRFPIARRTIAQNISHIATPQTVSLKPEPIVCVCVRVNVFEKSAKPNAFGLGLLHASLWGCQILPRLQKTSFFQCPQELCSNMHSAAAGVHSCNDPRTGRLYATVRAANYSPNGNLWRQSNPSISLVAFASLFVCGSTNCSFNCHSQKANPLQKCSWQPPKICILSMDHFGNLAEFLLHIRRGLLKTLSQQTQLFSAPRHRLLDDKKGPRTALPLRGFCRFPYHRNFA